MKKYAWLFTVCSILLASAGVRAQNDMQADRGSERTVHEWKTYGGAISVTETTPLAGIQEEPERFGEAEILVEGKISEVCENKGCWMVVTSGDEHTRVEFKDYGFFVPWDSDGKKVKMQGMLRKKTISAAAAEHMAGEMKYPPVKKEEIREKQDIIVFVASAVAIEGGTDLSGEQQEIISGKKEREGHQHEHDH